MNYELKDVQIVGGVVSNNDGTFTQQINVTVGVEDCPHEDIKTQKTISYTFSNLLTVQQAKDGIGVFAVNWVIENYPNTL